MYEELEIELDVEETVNLDAVRDHIEGIIEAVYKTGDVFMLESCLDEVCYHLSLETAKGDPKLTKRGKDEHE